MMSRVVPMTGTLLLASLLADAAVADRPERWRCEALRGTAYEYSLERDHWLTRVFPVEEIYILERVPGDRGGWTISRVDGKGGGLTCVPDNRPDQLACAGASDIRIDLAMGAFSMRLPLLEGQVGRTAAGRCRLQPVPP